MHDAAALWYRASWRFQAERWAQMRRIFGDRLTLRHCATLAYAPVIENGGFFEPHPNPRRAGKHAWRWLLPARHSALREALNEWTEADDDDPATPARRIGGLGPPCADWEHAVDGIFTEDLVACSVDLQQVTSTLLGAATVLGHPADAHWASRPVRVHATPLAWIESGFRGVVLVGSDGMVQDWLRACEPGLIVDDIRLGEALRIKMTRPIPALPPIMVAA